jgi:CBS domain-containing membrane protein
MNVRSLTVADLMSSMLITVSPTDDLSLVEELMRLARVRHVPVIEPSGALVGLISHRDLLSVAMTRLAGLTPEEDCEFKRSIQVHDVMTRELITVRTSMPVLAAARLLREHQLGCLPVVEAGELVGIVTASDFVDLVIDALRASEGEYEREAAVNFTVPEDADVTDP